MVIANKLPCNIIEKKKKILGIVVLECDKIDQEMDK